jgi:xylulokinase
VVPPPAEYVADGAARQAAWALAGGPEPPRWELAGAGTFEAAPTPAVRERYAACRDLTADQAERDKGAASPDTIAADRVADPIEGVART